MISGAGPSVIALVTGSLDLKGWRRPGFEAGRGRCVYGRGAKFTLADLPTRSTGQLLRPMMCGYC